MQNIFLLLNNFFQFQFFLYRPILKLDHQNIFYYHVQSFTAVKNKTVPLYN